MHGELAQSIALSAHGASFLRLGGRAPNLFPGHSTFRFVRELGVVHCWRPLGLFPVVRPIASDTATWFEYLRAQGFTTLRLFRWSPSRPKGELPPYIEAGFSNGLDVALLAQDDRAKSEVWVGKWDVTAPQDPSQRIWSVRYLGQKVDVGSLEGPSLQEAGNRLRRALERAREVAFDNSWQNWATVFSNALNELSSDDPTIAYHADLLPSNGYGLEARQVLAAVSVGWVLGGMGSWNDLAARDEGRYTSATAALHVGLLDAAVAATNSFEPMNAQLAV
jgi:hypothetical protein